MEQENNVQKLHDSELSPQRTPDRQSRHSLHLDVSGSSGTAFLKALDVKAEVAPISAGGLKRNDAMMNLDQPYQGSPVPKRRSMHGASNPEPTSERSIFEGCSSPAANTAGFTIHEDSNAGTPEDPTNSNHMGRPEAQAAPPTPSPGLSKRASSTRKSSILPRYGEKTSWGKRFGQRHLAQLENEAVSTPPRTRTPIFTANFEPPTVGPLFGSTTPIGNPPTQSTSIFQFAENKNAAGHHPLAQSTTLSASSSGNSFTEETSSAMPAPPVFNRAPLHPFSQSLPLGAERPSNGYSTIQQSTPAPGSLLYQGAFGSTGMVSKFNRNPEQVEKKIVPPDTPCKPWRKPSERFYTYPSASTPCSNRKTKSNNRNSFSGISSLTFQPPADASQPRDDKTDQEPSNFGRRSIFSRTIRHADVDGDVKLSDDSDYETAALFGTPTKNGLTTSFSNLSNLSELSENCSDDSLDSPSANRRSNGPRDPLSSAMRPSPLRQADCKFISRLPRYCKNSSLEQLANYTDSLPSFGRNRALRVSNPPSTLFASQKVFAKISGVGTASPLADSLTPRTPQELFLPENTSQLSISNNKLSPATPRSQREFRSSTATFSTPVHDDFRASTMALEPVLQSRFDKVEHLSEEGEFSIIFKVTEKSEPLDFSLSRRQSPSSLKEQIFVVKKTKQPYHGRRDRERKLREATILRALRDNDHIVQYVADWEVNDHLYIQTEFCENGSLKNFLDLNGDKGRVDDFCIFKILLDLTMGLREIHAAGFMHLDMKPANVFITFEGDVKIGDFGLARELTDCSPLDMEGDREYMAPEMLHGEFSPSSDIFSLGLMMVESITNCYVPGNGEVWHRLRNDDLSFVPSLAWSVSCETNPERSSHYSTGTASDSVYNAGDLFGSHKRSELLEPPTFMADPDHPESLRALVEWMISSQSHRRPTPDQLLNVGSLQWVAQRRKAPATVFEGRWGPMDLGRNAEIEIVDTEMTGV
ncbi:uncharacterized protein J7T54_004755 [Emericellopsis cladophorae]|uniref:Protein kinase domain-containing protein n=1 Tax=Emericellopsis cladophorae TaxID=2686198 RepID=A0A9P9Y628_9HYPO|nr:uncharacterized protein J7T54_004755 [Emericellopsis cladophorae]KAI6784209.1 hypothetical protein J7T54_004755 [Emericellopsis cladophorae]